MKNFYEWMIDTGKTQQLDEMGGILKNLVDRNVTGPFRSAMSQFDRRTGDQAAGANQRAGIVQLILNKARQLPTSIRKNVGRQLMAGDFGGMGDDRAVNPKARYGQVTQGE